MRSTNVRRITRQSRHIHGWFSPDAAGLFGLIDELQHEAGVRGDLFEIGVHHGKSAVMLGAMAREGEILGVCDVFGDQGANVSLSGLGNRATFDGNLRRIAPTSNVTVHEKRSSELTPEELGGPYRFFHVDGGHLAEDALGDLRLAAEVLHDCGVIVLDDPFRPDWPGVTEAALQFMQERKDYAPIALGFNKLALTPAPEVYEQLGSDRMWDYIPEDLFTMKRLPIAGREALIFWIHADHQMPRLSRFASRAHARVARVRRRLKPLASVQVWPSRRERERAEVLPDLTTADAGREARRRRRRLTRTAAPRRRVAPFPANDPNPYLRLLYGHLGRFGVEAVPEPELTLLWLWRSRRSVAFLHFHWNTHYHYERGGTHPWLVPLQSTIGVGGFAARLTVARALGYRIVWTIHELYPHESRNRRVDRRAGRALVRLSDLLIAHDAPTAEQVRAELGVSRDIEIVPHPSYVGAYPRGRTRAEVRAQLGLEPSTFVFIVFGHVRAYKELALVLEAFVGLEHADAALIVAGISWDAHSRAAVSSAAQRDPRIRPLVGFVPEHRVAELLGASDAAVSARGDGGTSGSILLALSESLPVVAARCPAYAALIGDDTAGWLFEPGSALSLRTALGRAAADREAAQVKGDVGRRRMEGRQWPDAARRTAELMLSVTGNGVASLPRAPMDVPPEGVPESALDGKQPDLPVDPRLSLTARGPRNAGGRSRRPTLSFCITARGPAARVRTLLEIMRPHVDEIVLAVDRDGDPEILDACGELADRRLVYELQGSPARLVGWIMHQCSCDWTLRLDDDEVPGASLLEALPELMSDRYPTEIHLDRRWLFPTPDRYIANWPWTTVFQGRMVRNVRGLWRFQGRVHTAGLFTGEKHAVKLPFYHFDLILNSADDRRRKVLAYEVEAPGANVHGIPENLLYLPELYPGLESQLVPREDQLLVNRLLRCPPALVHPRPLAPVEEVSFEEVDRFNSERPMSPGLYRASLALERPPRRLPPGTVSHVNTFVRNESDEAWPAFAEHEPLIRLGYRWWRPGADACVLAGRTLLNETIRPGHSAVVTLHMTAPGEPGEYDLEVDVVHEHVRWFGCSVRHRVVVDGSEEEARAVVGSPFSATEVLRERVREAEALAARAATAAGGARSFERTRRYRAAAALTRLGDIGRDPRALLGAARRVPDDRRSAT
jgi:glycosyltransferase involved in cell wall biosynthesis